jgi:hypothetical protein
MRTFINLPRTSVSRLSLLIVGSIGLQFPDLHLVKSYNLYKALSLPISDSEYVCFDSSDKAFHFSSVSSPGNSIFF